ncbi:effector protein NopP [Bradyrhizobium sp. UFLA05-153]
MQDFHGDEIEYIAANPQQYSRSVSLKAERTAYVAYRHGKGSDSESARYFSYQLGNQSVGLLRTDGGSSMSRLFEGESWREQFPGRTETTSTVDFRVTHPLVDNAGDILLEHQLRLDGERPLLLSNPVNPEAKARATALGFVEVSNSTMLLDPTQHPDKWTKNGDGEWQRANKPAQYLAKAEESESSDAVVSESAANTWQDSYDDDFM